MACPFLDVGIAFYVDPLSFRLRPLIVLFFVALVMAVEGVCDNRFVAAISVQKM
jgi:hypothetical protein